MASISMQIEGYGVVEAIQGASTYFSDGKYVFSWKDFFSGRYEIARYAVRVYCQFIIKEYGGAIPVDFGPVRQDEEAMFGAVEARQDEMSVLKAIFDWYLVYREGIQNWPSLVDLEYRRMLMPGYDCYYDYDIEKAYKSMLFPKLDVSEVIGGNGKHVVEDISGNLKFTTYNFVDRGMLMPKYDCREVKGRVKEFSLMLFPGVNVLDEFTFGKGHFVTQRAFELVKPLCVSSSLSEDVNVDGCRRKLGYDIELNQVRPGFICCRSAALLSAYYGNANAFRKELEIDILQDIRDLKFTKTKFTRLAILATISGFALPVVDAKYYSNFDFDFTVNKNFYDFGQISSGFVKFVVNLFFAFIIVGIKCALYLLIAILSLFRGIIDNLILSMLRLAGGVLQYCDWLYVTITRIRRLAVIFYNYDISINNTDELIGKILNGYGQYIQIITYFALGIMYGFVVRNRLRSAASTYIMTCISYIYLYCIGFFTLNFECGDFFNVYLFYWVICAFIWDSCVRPRQRYDRSVLKSFWWFYRIITFLFVAWSNRLLLIGYKSDSKRYLMIG